MSSSSPTRQLADGLTASPLLMPVLSREVQMRSVWFLRLEWNLSALQPEEPWTHQKGNSAALLCFHSAAHCLFIWFSTDDLVSASPSGRGMAALFPPSFSFVIDCFNAPRSYIRCREMRWCLIFCSFIPSCLLFARLQLYRNIRAVMHRLWSAAAAFKCINIGYKPTSHGGVMCADQLTAAVPCRNQSSSTAWSYGPAHYHVSHIAPRRYNGGDASSLRLILWTPPFTDWNDPAAWHSGILNSLKGLIVAVQLAPPRAPSHWCVPRPACASITTLRNRLVYCPF